MSVSKHRSGCPVGISFDKLADRWSLLIVRDLMVRGFRTFKEFRTSGEGIATNSLELLVWGARHMKTSAPRALITVLERNRAEVLAEVRRRWRERDSSPLIPRFADNFEKGVRDE